MMNLTNTQLPDQVQGSNIIAIDKVYYNAELIKYLSECRFQLIRTHKKPKHTHLPLETVEYVMSKNMSKRRELKVCIELKKNV